MNAYDFDDTIYNGESIVDFFIFCLKKDWWLLKFFPLVIFRFMEYKLNLLKIEKIYHTAEVVMNSFFKHSKFDYDKLVVEFWKRNYKKLKPEFLQMLKEDDLIITGCPNFLIDYIQQDLKAKKIICTEFNMEKRKLEFVCFGKNKVKAFKERLPQAKIDKFYTDSLSDIPFMELANEVYLVKGIKCKKVDVEKLKG